jgi:hypothetical protein
MNKQLTTSPKMIASLLNDNVRSISGSFRLTVPAISHHFVDRLEGRKLSGSQRGTLGQIAKGSLAFTPAEVSEIRFVNVNGKDLPVSIVINDIVFGVHPLNDNPPAPFSLREGKGTAIAKTVLAQPNSRIKGSTMIDGWRVVA